MDTPIEPKKTPQEVDRELYELAHTVLRRRLAHLATLDEGEWATSVTSHANRTARALAILDGTA
jgi:hypothetical protein